MRLRSLETCVPPAVGTGSDGRAVIIGEVLCDAFFRKGCNFSVRLSFVILGGIVYYLVMVLILWLKLDPNDLKLFTAVIVAAFLAVPYLKGQAKSSFHRLKKGGK